ncbi:hypothetical protein B1J97_02345 [Aeromonas veronii]|nr:hypothetical protein [Aeromonas veronii]RRA93041.1 hypothetical protein AVS_08265 [Aeromonas veronii bv. sobria]TNI71235.1 hypothetical protein CF109_16710 [Aeromonas veronii]
MSKKKRCTEEFKLAAVSLVLDLYSPPSQGVASLIVSLSWQLNAAGSTGLHLCGSNVDSEEKEKGHYC